MDLTMRTIDGGETAVGKDLVAQLAAAFDGELVTPDSAAYDETREIWNAMIDRRPGLIARCASADDVATAVHFGKQNGLLVSIRGAGHNIAGNAVADGALMIDLSGMKV